MKSPKTLAEKRCAEFLEWRAPHLLLRAGPKDDAVDIVLAELGRRLPRVDNARVPKVTPGSSVARLMSVES